MTAAPPPLAPDIAAGLRRLKLATIRQLAPELLITVNVRAQGQACPFRHQCFGCTRFRSDPSYVSELRAYLGRLLADRERLLAAAPELEEWARNQAIPADEEIAAVRRIIDRCQDLTSGLGPDQREQMDEAIAVLRRARAQLDTTVPGRRSPQAATVVRMDIQPGNRLSR